MKTNDATKAANIDSTVQNFSFPCKNFTTIMAIKHELQHSVFIGKCNKTDNATAEEDYVNAAVIILSYLQTLADILQNTMVVIC